MNLQENIFRIQSLLSENNLKDKVLKLVDKFGIEYVYETMGDVVINYLSKDDKIKFIKNKVALLCEEFGSSGISVHDLYRDPIFYKEENGELEQMEYFDNYNVYVDVYDEVDHLDEYMIHYEMLPEDSLNDVFEFFIYE